MNNSPLLNCYNRLPVMIEKGKGAYLWDTKGKKYLDFAAGIATNSLGHCPDIITTAIQQQSNNLIHAGNLFHIKHQHDFANLIVQKTFADKVFFCSSGLEALEAAIKFMRLWGYKQKDKANRIITFNGGFHGRSMACISAGGGKYAKIGFAPMLDGFDIAKRNDLESVKSLITKNTCGILLEPIQAEGGIHKFDTNFLKELRELADKKNIILCFDEVQCGFGRTGYLYDYMRHDVKPDILTSAKGIGGGFPLAAVLCTDKINNIITPSCHGSTYGGNSLAMQVGLAVINEVSQADFLQNVQKTGNYLKQELLNIKNQSILDIRGEGLLIAIEFSDKIDSKDFQLKCADNGLIVTKASGGNIIRLVPALNITKKHVDEFINKFMNVINLYNS